MSDESPLIAVRAANGVGKSLHACHKLAKNAIENPGTYHRLVGPTAPMRRATTDRYLAEILRGHLDPRCKFYPGTGWNLNGSIVLANGSEIELKAYSDDPQGQEGQHHLYTTVLDEVPNQAHFMANKGRCKQLICTFTVQTKTPPDWFRLEIEGGDESPLRGRTVHETGWVQYVIPFEPRNVPFYSPARYEEKSGRYRGTDEEDRRIWAKWDSASSSRTFTGWGKRLERTPQQIRQMLTVETRGVRRMVVDAMRYGIDWGTGSGKQCQYLVLYSGDCFYVVHEWSSPGGHVPMDCARQVKVALEQWVGPWPASLYVLFRRGVGSRPDNGVWGDINSAGPTAAGRTLNVTLSTCLRQLAHAEAGAAEMIKVRTPRKAQGWKEARELHADIAMLEDRFFVSTECPRLIRALKQYEGGDRDPMKDPIDACLYAIQDLLVTQDRLSDTQIRR